MICTLYPATASVRYSKMDNFMSTNSFDIFF